MNAPEEVGTLERLERLARSVTAARVDLREKHRQLDLPTIAERVTILEDARSTAHEFRSQLSEAVGPERERAEKAEADIEEACLWAQTLYQRKERWETRVEPHIQTIKKAGNDAARIHSHLRKARRDLSAAEVEVMKTQLEAHHRAALEAKMLLQVEEVPFSVRGRLQRSINTIARAMEDATGAFENKHQWEMGQAANAAAVEEMLSALEVQARDGASPADVRNGVRRITREIDRRRPLARAARKDFEARLRALGSDATDELKEQQAARKQRSALVRKRISELMGELEALVGPAYIYIDAPAAQAPAQPGDQSPVEAVEAQAPGGEGDEAPPEAEAAEIAKEEAPGDEGDEAPPEAEVAEIAEEEAPGDEGDEAPPEAEAAEIAEEEAPGDEGDEAPPEAVIKEAKPRRPSRQRISPPVPELGPKEAEAALRMDRELQQIASDPALGHGERRRLGSRIKALSKRVGVVHRQLMAHRKAALRERVEATIERAQSGKLQGVLREIQATQKAVGRAGMRHRHAEELRGRLREAWNVATARIEADKQHRVKAKQGQMRSLGGHFDRWQRRVSGLNGLIERLEYQLEERTSRGAHSTSIGYRVLVEQFKVKTEARLEELRQTREELIQKIEDVKPRLEAAGWPWPDEEAEPDAAAGEAPPAGVGVEEEPPQGATSEEGGEATPQAGSDTPSELTPLAPEVQGDAVLNDKVGKGGAASTVEKGSVEEASGGE